MLLTKYIFCGILIVFGMFLVPKMIFGSWEMKTQVYYKHSALADKIVKNIRCGIYTAGEKLPAERSLCQEFSVSRNTVRDSLAMLLNEGVIERRGRGAFVSDKALAKIEGISGPDAVQVWALITFSMYDNPIYRTVFETIRSGLDSRVCMEVCFSENFPGAVEQILKPSDIVLIFGDCDSKNLMRIKSYCRELILINSRSQAFCSVEPDNYAAGRAVAAYLYENGHRLIGTALCGPDCSGEFGDRYRGARDYLAEHGVTLLTETVNDHQEEFGIMRDFLNSYRRRGATAVICFKDISALMIYELARQQKLDLPQEMSVVSFDDRCYTASVKPALSTVRFPAEELGLAVLNQLNSILSGSVVSHEPIKIMPALLRRESVARIVPADKKTVRSMKNAKKIGF